MTSSHARNLFAGLFGADPGADVVDILTKAGYWQNRDAWRPLADSGGNNSTVANQQEDPAAALAEKLTNAIDARLLNAWEQHLVAFPDAKMPESPQDAVAELIAQDPKHGSDVWQWSEAQRAQQAECITVAVTGGGAQSPASVTIVDQGEGQTPDRFPRTFCSLASGNKDRIPFALGRHNMGGTGALRYCGQHHLQLIVSRRNPALVPHQDGSSRSSHWGFTVIRRETPGPGEKNSIYTYLAPVGSDVAPRCGSVLSFPADSLPLFPYKEKTTNGKSVVQPYGRETEYGTLIKLYDFWSDARDRYICAPDKFSLMSRLEVCLTDLLLPATIYDCRASKKIRDVPTDVRRLYGLATRLKNPHPEPNGPRLEPGFPDSASLSIRDARGDEQHVSVTVYAFALGVKDSKPKARFYRSADYGVVFTLNGQTHAHRADRFFHGKGVARGYLADSLFVVIGCRNLTALARDDLFLASRDRVAGTKFATELLDGVRNALKDNRKLTVLQEQRMANVRRSRSPEDTAASQAALEEMLQNEPALARYLLDGKQLRVPPLPAQLPPYQGKTHPTHFKHVRAAADGTVQKRVESGKEVVIDLETDAEDGYFTRAVNAGTQTLRLLTPCPSKRTNATWGQIATQRWSLQRGRAKLAFVLSNPQVGDHYQYELEVTDPTLLHPFIIRFGVGVVPHKHSVGGGTRSPRLTHALPAMEEITEAQWETMGGEPFTPLTAVRIYQTNGSSDDAPTYDWFWNADHTALKAEIARVVREHPTKKELAQSVRATFYQSLLLTGLSALRTIEQMEEAAHSNGNGHGSGHELPSAEQFVEYTTSAVAPVAWQIVDKLSGVVARAASSDAEDD